MKSKKPSLVEQAMRETREELTPLVAALDLPSLSRHNKGYLDYADDPTTYFIAIETHNHLQIVNDLVETLPPNSSIMDIGFFIPVIPIVLAKLGFHVSSIEKLAFYGTALDGIVNFATKRYGIKLYDLDILADATDFLKGKFHAVILSAILEHLNGTPKYLLGKARQMGAENARYLVAVPNVASLRKRLTFLLKGQPPLPPIATYFHSDYPFTGHNREYTLSDLSYVMHEAGFSVCHLKGYSRPIRGAHSAKDWLMRIFAQACPGSMKEQLLAVANLRV